MKSFIAGSPRKTYEFENKRLKVLRDIFSIGAVLAWWSWGGLVMSWAGHRPLTPTPATGQVIPYNDHGILFVSQHDLDASHAILAIGALSAVLAYVSYLADRRRLHKRSSN